MIQTIFLRWVLPITLLLALIAALMHSSYKSGFDSAQLKHQNELTKQNLYIDELKVKATQLTTQTTVQYVDRIRVVKEKGDTIVKQIPIYITTVDDSNCNIPDTFGLLWNASNAAAIDVSPTSNTDGETRVYFNNETGTLEGEIKTN